MSRHSTRHRQSHTLGHGCLEDKACIRIKGLCGSRGRRVGVGIAHCRSAGVAIARYGHLDDDGDWRAVGQIANDRGWIGSRAACNIANAGDGLGGITWLGRRRVEHEGC